MSKNDSLLVAGTGSMLIGAMCGVFVTNPLYMCGLYLAGGGSIVYHFLQNNQNAYIKLFKNLGLCNKDQVYPMKLSKRSTAYGHEIRFSLPIGFSLKDFEKHQDAIEAFLKHKIVMMYDRNKNVVVQVYENELKKVYPYDETIQTKPYIVPLGYTHGEKLVTLNIKKAVHVMVAGETGGGKSSVLRLLLTYLIAKTDAIIHLIDLKGGVEGRLFQPYVKTFAKDIVVAEELIYKIKTEVERRYELLFQCDCIDIDEYNKRYKDKQMTREFLVIDEFSVLSNEKENKDLIKEIESLGALARACGIHLIICMQRCDSKILSPRIKANCPTVIGLKTRDDVNSRVIGIKGLEKLRGDGHSILQFQGKDTELQIMFIHPDVTRQLLKKKRNKIKKVATFIPKKSIESNGFDCLKKLEEDR